MRNTIRLSKVVARGMKSSLAHYLAQFYTASLIEYYISKKTDPRIKRLQFRLKENIILLLLGGTIPLDAIQYIRRLTIYE